MTDQQRRIGRSIAHLGFIAEKLGDLHGPSTVVNELLQNADDAHATQVRFTVSDASLTVWNDGTFARCADPLAAVEDCSWLGEKGNRCDFHSFRLVAGRDKQLRDETTGAFGIGFTSVYQLTDHPVLTSNGERWTMDESAPEQERILVGVFPTGHVGTTFELPWARASTDLRRQLQQEPLDDAYISGFGRVLREAVPAALVFLKNVDQVIVEDEASVWRCIRRDEGDIRVIMSDGGDRRRTLLIEGSFVEVADHLKRRHSVINPRRSPSVTVAVPLEADAPVGRLYATLPSEQYTDLPISIDATFFPATDRKRIRFDDDAVSEWNRAAIDGAASLISSNIERVAEALGNRGFIDFLTRAKGLAQTDRPTNDHVDSIWENVLAVLPQAAVVPIVGASGRVSLDSARFWADPSEADAADLLAPYGLHLIAPEVKNEWWSLRGGPVQVQPLTLREVLDRWLSTRFPPVRAGELLDPSDGSDRIWPLVSTLITRGSSGEVLAALRRCALIPDLEGRLHPVEQARRWDDDTLRLRRTLGLFVPVVDETRLEAAPGLLDLVPSFHADDLLPALVDVIEERDELAPEKLAEALRWWSARWVAEGSKELGDELLATPLVGTARGLVSLGDLSLPGTFTDPLDLADVLALPRLEDLRSFLRNLGMRELTFGVYCVDHVGPAIEAGGVDSSLIGAFVELLAKHHSSVWNDDAVRATLSELELVLCDDGRRRRGCDTYLGSGIRDVIGDDAAVAASIGGVAPGHSRTVLEWLGAEAEPRPEHLRARLAWLADGPAQRRQAAMAILEFAHRLLDLHPDRLANRYSFLQDEPWLPVKGRGRGAVPRTLFDEFRAFLFESQGDFVDLPRTFQRDHAAILRWLDVGSEPTVRLVVDHLLHQAKRREPVRDAVYPWLNDNAPSPEVADLRDAACIRIGSHDDRPPIRYVRPSQVFWGAHGLGRFRMQLPHAMASLQALFDRLEVAEQPSARDAADVLIELAIERGGEEAPIDLDDQKVVHECWRIISRNVLEGSFGGPDLEELTTSEVALDRAGFLRRPDRLFLIESERLTQRFGSDLMAHLVPRNEETWRGLQAAGLRGISDAVKASIVSLDPADDGGHIEGRLRERNPALIRFLSPIDAHARDKVDGFFAEFEVQACSRLEVQYHVDLGANVLSTVAAPESALCDREASILYCTVEEDGDVEWLEIARELLRAIGVDAASAANGVLTAESVLRAADLDAAQRILDACDIPPLDLAVVGRIEGSVIGDFDNVDEPDDGDDHDADDRSGEARGSGEVEPPSSEVGPTEPVDLEDAEDSTTEDEQGSGDSDGRRGGAGDGAPPSESSEGGGDGTGGTGTDGTSGHRTGPGAAGDEPSGSRSGAGRSSGGTEGAGSSPYRRQHRRRSYVAPVTATSDPERDREPLDPEVERAAVDAVLEWERDHGRNPREMEPGNEGFDIESEGSDGLTRFIEVKGTKLKWGVSGVDVSSAQFRRAQRDQEHFWLYVVDLALTDPRVHPIQDPASKVDVFAFDDRWALEADYGEEQTRAPLPELQLPQDRAGIPHAIEVRRCLAAESVTIGWMGAGFERERAWFGFRIDGTALGAARRGGIAIVDGNETVPPDEESDDVLLVRLHDQMDPDSLTPYAFGRWTVIWDEAGAVRDIRLDRDGNTAPLTVRHPQHLQVLGRVRRTVPLAELIERGWA